MVIYVFLYFGIAVAFFIFLYFEPGKNDVISQFLKIVLLGPIIIASILWPVTAIYLLFEGLMKLIKFK